MKNTTIVLPVRINADKRIKSICLGMKKRGFGKGKWNGVGGKLAKDESFEEAARRETFEEINIEIRNIYKVAELSFFFQDEKQRTYPETRSEVFIVDKWSGKAEESEEMRPKWFKVEKLLLVRCGRQTEFGYLK